MGSTSAASAISEPPGLAMIFHHLRIGSVETPELSCGKKEHGNGKRNAERHLHGIGIVERYLLTRQVKGEDCAQHVSQVAQRLPHPALPDDHHRCDYAIHED